jgi:serine/threonine protein kinase
MSSALAANTVDAAALADELARLGVLPPERLAAVLADFPGGGPGALVDFLVIRGELTPLQAARVNAGDARSLVLGPYLLTRLHGTGTFGPLYRATHKPSGADVLVRVLPLRSLWRARQVKPLIRQLATVPLHPALAPLADADTANGNHYLVWPLTEGRTLADRVRPGDPLPPPVAATLLARLADALAACHARRVVHGLLSPLAVSVGGAAEPPRVLELGAGMVLAQNLAGDESLLDTMSAGVAVAGLLDYAAPEYLTDPTQPTAATDQYGLGAVGYFALTSHPPYPDGSLTGRLLAQRTGAAVPVAIANPAVPPALAAVIDRMMSPRPEDRFGSLDEVRDALAVFAGDEPAFAEEDTGGDPFAHLDGSLSGHGASSLGAISWSSAGNPLPERDDSDASVAFDLPPPAPEDEESFAPLAGPATALTDTPRAAHGERGQPADETPRLLAALKPPAGRSPPPPEEPLTPAPADGSLMANIKPRDTTGGRKPPRTPDPRASMPTPVQWHTEDDRLADESESDGPPASGSGLFKSIKRSLLFWKPHTDVVQVSVFGPPAVSPGQTARVTVYLHTPDAAGSVRTLSRAFQHDAELIGSGYAARQVPRAAEVGVHLFTSNAAAAKTLFTFTWRGTPHRVAFDVHVPWESPSGPAPGLVSVGRDNVRIGKVGFNLHILPRKG